MKWREFKAGGGCARGLAEGLRHQIKGCCTTKRMESCKKQTKVQQKLLNAPFHRIKS